MKNHFKKLLLVLLVNVTHFISYSDELFYQHSSYKNFKLHFSKCALVTNEKNSKENLAHLERIAIIFTTRSLESNPDYVDTVIKNYKDLKINERKIMLQSLYNMKGDEIIKILSENKKFIVDENISEKLNTMNFIVKNSTDFTKSDLNYNSCLADYLWSAFYATGDRKFVTKMLDFVHAWSQDLQKLAWEMLNRDSIDAMKKIGHIAERDFIIKDKDKYKDIVEGVQKSNHLNVEQLKSLYIVLWSLESNLKQHSELKGIIQY